MNPWMPFGPPGPDAVLLSEDRFRMMKDLLVWVNAQLEPYALPADKNDFRETLKRCLSMPRTATLEMLHEKLKPYHGPGESLVTTLDHVLFRFEALKEHFAAAQRREDIATEVIEEQREQIRLLREELKLAEVTIQNMGAEVDHLTKPASRKKSTPHNKESRK